MKPFSFRLQRILEYRELVEQWARDAFLEARGAKIEAEQVLQALDCRRSALLCEELQELEDGKALEPNLNTLDEDQRQHQAVCELLVQEESSCREKWLEKKREMEALQTLRAREHAEWMREVNREEQKSGAESAARRKAS